MSESGTQRVGPERLAAICRAHEEDASTHGQQCVYTERKH